jgi:hypothetical protein
MPYSSGPFICLVTLIINIYGLGVGISSIKKFTSCREWGITPGAWAIRHFICLVTLIINIYGLGVAPTLGRHISTFRGYQILFYIRNPYINRFTNYFSIHSKPSYPQKVVLHSITARFCLRSYYSAIWLPFSNLQTWFRDTNWMMTATHCVVYVCK